MDLQLAGKTALVTGARAGIGRSIALALAREGVRVAIAARSRDGLQSVARAITEAGGPPPVLVAGDLATRDGPAAIAAQTLAAFGGHVDILINNAGASRPAPPDAGDEFWEEALALNFDSARRLTSPLIAPMRAAGWGRIVNLGGALVARTMNASSPAKSALLSWSRTLSIELAPHGITVNAISPGRINSEQIATRLHPTAQSRDDFIRQSIPAGRFGEPEELADLAVFLASPRAGYISGAVIPVDGAMIRIS